jgi:predicted RNA-binding protein YlqC (UPF0109 family)
MSVLYLIKGFADQPEAVGVIFIRLGENSTILFEI